MILTFITFILLFILGETVMGEAALSALLGVVGTYITQFIKKFSGANGNSALVLTIAVSAVLGFISAYSVGGWDSGDVLGSSAIVFSLATIAYRFLLSKDAVITPNTSV